MTLIFNKAQIQSGQLEILLSVKECKPLRVMSSRALAHVFYVTMQDRR